mmetsp:Transcript_4099/g.5381  ORF Transcript_4099/g.5381 Transcript_4099/m.5381 type:complete len:263 (+) Transcript_4099:185-973(+)|eukprot:CAMPEP_0198142632 /NCGR_PEP_ID=MMETSP1443-20131203/5375_1 /TAXON_ID=186043 /ORGANISM="Entomoneis sp., Strain CCMP2396" /LENGTH=262 /DNA_ID=CAMNT_0043805689 /DNA_START=86 /DNA_END=874 /DNA_ORIENTATION=-
MAAKQQPQQQSQPQSQRDDGSTGDATNAAAANDFRLQNSAASSSSKGMERAYLIFSNGTMMIAWARVLRVIVRNRWEGLQDEFSEAATGSKCLGLLTPALHLAIAISFMEVFNASVGLTRSKPHLSLMFCSVRAFAETVVAPRLSHCGIWSHLFTATCWSLGDMIRFGCFLLDLMVPGGTLAKSVRYNVGPIMFPLGALGELLMVGTYSVQTGQWFLLVAAVIAWPIGVYPLMNQLLKQRSKFFARVNTAAASDSGEKIKVV